MTAHDGIMGDMGMPAAIGRRHHRVVVVRRRLLLVTWWFDMPGVIRGSVVPLLPCHLNASSNGFRVPTINQFKINRFGSEWCVAEVQNISVAEKRQRRRWGMSLVEALLIVFPDLAWRVSAPNEKSTALFRRLHQLHPEQIIQPSTFVQ